MGKVPALGTLTKKVHPLFAGFGVFCLSYAVLFGVFDGLQTNNVMNIINSGNPVPLWLNKAQVLNLGRIFFSLDDSRGNTPNILHDGL